MKTRKLNLSGFIQNELSKEETLTIKGGFVGDPPTKYTIPTPASPIPPMPPLTIYPEPPGGNTVGNGAG